MAGDAGISQLLRFRAGAMTGVAGEIFMAALQREIRLCPMIEAPERPAVRVMTVGARGPQRPLVRIFRQVAIGAADTGIFIGGSHVTGFAWRADVQAQQRKAAHVMIKPHLVGPGRLTVTGGAGRAQLSLVRVGVTMTTGARGLQPDFLGVLLVAIGADRLLMAAAQRKLGILVVVEADGFPGDLAVAVAADGTVGSLMHVVCLVTIDAAARQLGALHGRRMAQRAHKRPMTAAQGKIGLGVIEFGRLPGGGAVALIAVAAKDALVNVAESMAGNAGQRRFLVTRAGMAGAALNFCMRARQREFRLGVIKGRLAPSFRGVAADAVLAQVPFVNVPVFMAIDASIRGIAELATGRMTSGADGRGVGPGELEIG